MAKNIYLKELYTVPETNSSHLKMDGWKTTFLLGRPIFRCYVSFREGSQQMFRDVKRCHPKVSYVSVHHLPFSICGMKIKTLGPRSVNWHIYIQNRYIYIYLPGTQTSLVLIGTDLVLEAKQRTNGFQVCIYIFIYTCVAKYCVHNGTPFPLNQTTQNYIDVITYGGGHNIYIYPI